MPQILLFLHTLGRLHSFCNLNVKVLNKSLLEFLSKPFIFFCLRGCMAMYSAGCVGYGLMSSVMCILMPQVHYNGVLTNAILARGAQVFCFHNKRDNVCLSSLKNWANNKRPQGGGMSSIVLLSVNDTRVSIIMTRGTKDKQPYKTSNLTISKRYFK